MCISLSTRQLKEPKFFRGGGVLFVHRATFELINIEIPAFARPCSLESSSRRHSRLGLLRSKSANAERTGRPLPQEQRNDRYFQESRALQKRESPL
jgi:hypothetical protein